jgi:hypothetical protein
MSKNKGKKDNKNKSSDSSVTKAVVAAKTAANKIAGVDVGRKFGAADIARIQEARPNISVQAIQEKAKAADVKIKPNAQSFFNAARQEAADQAKQEEKERISSIIQDLGVLPGTGTAGIIPGEEIVPFVNFDLAQQGANFQTQKEIEQLRQAGQTERQKLVNENNLAVTGAEVKGKLDLQGIVNAGYKNIANIERGSNMFSSIMGAFNF